jgi:hypothetical protein
MAERKKKKKAHQQWYIITHHKLYIIRQRRALGEVDEVLERESERYMLVHLD